MRLKNYSKGGDIQIEFIFALHEKLHFSGMRRPVFLLIFEESCVNVNIVNYYKIVTLCKNVLSPLIHITQLYKQLNDMQIEEL